MKATSSRNRSARLKSSFSLYSLSFLVTTLVYALGQGGLVVRVVRVVGVVGVLTDQNVIFGILEPPAFRPYSICWVTKELYRCFCLCLSSLTSIV